MKNRETITIPLKIESRNVIDKMHWAKKMRLRKIYEMFIRQQISHYRLKKASTEQKFSLEITTFRKRRILDAENIDTKQLIDALVNEDFIYDDAEKYIGKPIITQQKANEECTIITREEK